MGYDLPLVKRLALIAVVAASSLVLAREAFARPASQGWYAERGLGAVAFLPSASSDAAIGPGLNLRVGRDIFSFFSLGVNLAASSHEATVPAPPEGEWFQIYRGNADARIGGRFDRIAIFVEGGIGLAMISSNMKSSPSRCFEVTLRPTSAFA